MRQNLDNITKGALHSAIKCLPFTIFALLLCLVNYRSSYATTLTVESTSYSPASHWDAALSVYDQGSYTNFSRMVFTDMGSDADEWEAPYLFKITTTDAAEKINVNMTISFRYGSDFYIAGGESVDIESMYNETPEVYKYSNSIGYSLYDIGDASDPNWPYSTNGGTVYSKTITETMRPFSFTPYYFTDYFYINVITNTNYAILPYVGCNFFELSAPPMEAAISDGSAIFEFGASATLDLTEASVRVSEPSTLLLLGSGLVGLIGYGKRRIAK